VQTIVAHCFNSGGYKQVRIKRLFFKLITAIYNIMFFTEDIIMDYRIEKFKSEHIERAYELFIENYKHEQNHVPLLPAKILNESELIIDAIRSRAGNPGTVILHNDKLISFMLTWDYFEFKGQKNAIVPEYCHGSIDTDKKKLYQLMYMNLASQWIKDGVHLHCIGHLAHDHDLRDILNMLGFGAILAERVRDLSPIKCPVSIDIVHETDKAKLIELQQEHMRYYPESPIFILKEADKDSVSAELEEHEKNNDAFLIYYDNNIPVACFIVGESALMGEGRLLKKTNTAQIKSAFIKPEYRGKGIGVALLNETVKWARENCYERLFVEHETANYFGGNFWWKYFESYLYFSMRYIDNRI
jgi:GNAT superfamily N-acetyltransferase